MLIGLSPRVRGNHYLIMLVFVLLRSIPARAGEPCLRKPAHPPSRVYPRACGGTSVQLGVGTRLWGLSPRVRGNLNSNAGFTLPYPIHSNLTHCTLSDVIRALLIQACKENRPVLNGSRVYGLFARMIIGSGCGCETGPSIPQCHD